MKVYIAAPWSARATVVTCLDELAAIGYEPACTWPSSELRAAGTEDSAIVAATALEEVRSCDILVLLTRSALDTEHGTSGGRHVEVGIALARRRRVLVVGEPENAFHWLDQVDRAPDWHGAVVHLARLLVDQPRKRKPRAPRVGEAGHEVVSLRASDVVTAPPGDPNSYDVERS